MEALAGGRENTEEEELNSVSNPAGREVQISKGGGDTFIHVRVYSGQFPFTS